VFDQVASNVYKSIFYFLSIFEISSSAENFIKMIHGISRDISNIGIHDEHDRHHEQHKDEKTKNTEKVLNNEKAKLSDIPFVQKVKEMDLHQRRSIGALYACASFAWYNVYPKNFSKLLESLELQEHDTFDVVSVAETSINLRKNERIEHLKNYALKIDDSKETRWLVLLNYLIICMSDGNYDARIRVSAQFITKVLGIDLKKMSEAEDGIAHELCKALAELEEVKRKKSTESSGRIWKMGLAGLIGGGLLLLTGGLAAPLVLPAMGALIGAVGTTATAFGLGSLAAVTAAGGSILMLGGVAMVTGIFGAVGAGLATWSMNKRTAGVDVFKFSKALKVIEKDDHLDEEHVKNQEGMQVYLGVSGLLRHSKEDEEFIDLWEDMYRIYPHGEHHAVIWEPEKLYSFGNIIYNLVMSKIAGQLKSWWLAAVSTTAAGLLSAASWPITVLGFTQFMTNPWSMVMDRAEKGGKLLAEVLSSRVQGNRPVTLIGSSTGARLIFECLKELEQRNQLGIVENAFLIGMPYSSEDQQAWRSARRVVAGRLVNAFSKNDWVLAYLYRCMEMRLDVAGLDVVPFDGVENINIDDIIEGHNEYADKVKMDRVLRKLRINESV
jgi:hypothetical protein